MKITVSCYAGYRGEETPRHFRLGERDIDIIEILDRWVGPDHRYFKVRGGDDAIYILRHDPITHAWEMIFFKDAACGNSVETGRDETTREKFNKDGGSLIH